MLCALALCLLGCSETSAPGPASAQALNGSWAPLDDYVEQPEHAQALRVARTAIEAERAGDPVDFQYRVSFRDGEYSVLVWYVVGYREDGSALMQPGGLSIVVVSADYELDRIIAGH